MGDTIATASLPVVRVRLPCADAREFWGVRAPELAVRGLVIRSDHVRPVGARVRLEIELSGGGCVHDGLAVVAGHAPPRGPGGRPGFLLRIEELAEAAAPGPRPPAAATPADGGDDPISLEEYLFSDLDLPDPTADTGPIDLELAPASAAEGSEEAARGPSPLVVAAAEEELLAPDDAFEPTPFEPVAPAPRFVRLRRVAPLAAAALVAAVIGGAAIRGLPRRTPAEVRSAEIATQLRRADERLRAGRLAGPGGDTALDHLTAARELAPDDPRLEGRLRLLAGVFADLGERALARGDLDEAAAHFQAALQAEPGSDALRQRLREAADRATAQAGRGADAGARVRARTEPKGHR